MSYYRDQLEAWLKGIDVQAERVLDIGGADKPVSLRVRKWDVGYYEIADIERGHKINIDLNHNSETVLAENAADVVFCLEVMEYIWNPVQAMHNLFAATKPGGLLYISFPFIYPMHKPVGTDMLRYTEEGAEKLLHFAGFEVVENIPRVHKQVDVLRAMYAADGMHTRHDYTVPHTGYMITARRP